jgi:hypothetical protein
MRDFSLDEAVYWGLGGLKMDRMLGLSLGSYERDPSTICQRKDTIVMVLVVFKRNEIEDATKERSRSHKL